MCGERLPAVKWLEAVPLDDEPIPESGPPELDDVDPDRVAYLLDGDEEEKGHPLRLYLALLFLIVALVLLAMHWRQYAHRWISDYVARSAVVSQGADNPDEGENSPGQSKSASGSTPTSASQPAPETAYSGGLKSDSNEKGIVSSVDANASNLPVRSTPLPRMPEPAITKPSSRPQAKQPKALPLDASSLANSGDRLASDGERYLYGNGVVEDCAIARKKLAMGAERQNTHALTLLGTMSATGHCAPRDLPTAYQWFAKALHADPNNRRLDQDLNSIWKQMTPSERQSALKSK